MTIYTYCAENYCEDCGLSLRRRIKLPVDADADDDTSYDSDDYPKPCPACGSNDLTVVADFGKGDGREEVDGFTMAVLEILAEVGPTPAERCTAIARLAEREGLARQDYSRWPESPSDPFLKALA